MADIMLTTVSVLACSACAFVFGGILGKAYFASLNPAGSVKPAAENTDSFNAEQLEPQLETQRNKYRKRMVALKNVISKHEETRDQIRDKLIEIEVKYEQRGNALKESQAQLEAAERMTQGLEQKLEQQSTDHGNAASAEKELSMLRIERDDLAARLSRIEAEQNDKPDTAPDEEADQISRMREIMGELRESLATSNRRVHDLELQLHDSNQRINILQSKLENWKQRVAPLTRQLKHQKEKNRQLRLANPQIVPSESSADNLQTIQGIGPVIEARLHQQGINQFQQLAEMTPDAMVKLCRQLSIPANIPERDSWSEQARTLCQPVTAKESA